MALTFIRSPGAQRSLMAAPAADSLRLLTEYRTHLDFCAPLEHAFLGMHCYDVKNDKTKRGKKKKREEMNLLARQKRLSYISLPQLRSSARIWTFVPLFSY